MLGLVSPASTPSAHAAEIPVTNLTIAVDPTEVTYGWQEAVTTTINFCTPNTAVAGDTFTLDLPSELGSWPSAFTVKNPGGAVMYTVALNQSRATFTLTAEGAAENNLCLVASFSGTSGSTPAGSYPLRYVINGAQTITRGPLVVKPATIIAPQVSGKNGWFNVASDECRQNPDACLTWRFQTKIHPGAQVVIDDPAGPNWAWACTRMSDFSDLRVITYANGTRRIRNGWQDPVVKAMITSFACSPGSLQMTVNTSSLATNESLEVALVASATQPGGVGGVTYRNSATMTVGGEVGRFSPTVTSTLTGGISTNDVIQITKADQDGNAADTQADAASLPTGETRLALTVRNTGSTSLRNITVTDELVAGTGRVSGLTCDFTSAGGPAAGSAWAGPMASGASFTCTADLTGVIGAHHDRATVSAEGNQKIDASDDYWATGVPETMNLALAKTVVGAADPVLGSEVEYHLTPRNTGNTAAVAGWSVTEVLPDGMELVSMSGPGYTCAALTCTAQAPLAGGAAGEPVTVRVRVTTLGEIRNIAYVSPAATDRAETDPLVVPAPGTDPALSATDNDSGALVTVRPVPPAPTPAPEPTPTPTLTPAAPAPTLPQTGAPVAPWQVGLAAALLTAGTVLLVVGRRRA